MKFLSQTEQETSCVPGICSENPGDLPERQSECGKCPEKFPAARYHSLAAIEETLPEELVVTARAEDGEIMAVEHKEYPVYGVQFHPESVMTPDGRKMIENFLERV